MNINIPEDVLMYDPFCIALVYDVSANEVQKIFHNYVKNMGTCFHVRKYMTLSTHM